MVQRRASRSALGVAVAVVAGVVIGGGPAGGVGTASADVTVTPAQAVQGEAARLTFLVTEDRPGAHTTQLELRLPEETPVAETWPLSVPDWAPRITMRPVDQPVAGIHHGSVTEVVGAITWIRATPAGKSPEPAELSISLGPLPMTDRMAFTVVQTYSDGFVVSWDQVPTTDGVRPERPAAVVALDPAPGAAPEVDAGEGGAAAAGQADGSVDGGLGLLDVVLALALLIAVGLAGWFLFRNRRGVADLPVETGQPEQAAPATAGLTPQAGPDGPATPKAEADTRAAAPKAEADVKPETDTKPEAEARTEEAQAVR